MLVPMGLRWKLRGAVGCLIPMSLSHTPVLSTFPGGRGAARISLPGPTGSADASGWNRTTRGDRGSAPRGCGGREPVPRSFGIDCDMCLGDQEPVGC